MRGLQKRCLERSGREGRCRRGCCMCASTGLLLVWIAELWRCCQKHHSKIDAQPEGRWMIFGKLLKSLVPVPAVYDRNLDFRAQYFGLRLTVGGHLLYIDWSGAHFDSDCEYFRSVVVPVNLKRTFDSILVAKAYCMGLVRHLCDLEKLRDNFHGGIAVTPGSLNCNGPALGIINIRIRSV